MHILKGDGTMKKIISLLCSLALVVSMFPVHVVFAAETENCPNTQVIEVVAKEDVSTRAASKGLYYYEDYFLVNQDVHYIVVTPEQGANLRIWIDSDSPVNITAEYTNWFGFYHGFYDQDFAAGERDVLISSGCDGKPYRISIRTDSWAHYSILVYQN